MTKQSQYAKALEEYAKTRDFSSFKQESFSKGMHIMLIEEEAIKRYFLKNEKAQKESSLLEKVELTDFWKIENGRTNKTR